jgi:hypothetical protein
MKPDDTMVSHLVDGLQRSALRVQCDHVAQQVPGLVDELCVCWITIHE